VPQVGNQSMLHYDARSTNHQAEVIAAPETWLKGQISEFSFFEWLANDEFGRCSSFPSWSS